MTAKFRTDVAVAVCAAAVALASSAVVALAGTTSYEADEAGICTSLGCRSGPTKCADGTFTLPGGTTGSFTCYTTLADS